MQVLLRLLRHRGTRLAAKDVDSTQWTEGVLCMIQMEGGRCLGLRGVLCSPDASPMASLFSPSVVRVQGEVMILRGIERVTDEAGATAAVVQEWAIKHRGSLGPAGLLSGEARERRSVL